MSIIYNLPKPGYLAFWKTFLLLIFINNLALTQAYQIMDAKGNGLTMDELMGLTSGMDVVFFGENHGDTIAHQAQLHVYQAMLAANKQVALSLEMFERDVQSVVNEYVGGLITEDFLKKDGRAWNNYDRDYKPLLELAKETGNKVVAANAPRRYIRMVSKNGMAALQDLPAESKKFLPKLPFHMQGGRYEQKFSDLMGGMHDMKNNHMYQSQNLWDVSMADSILNFYKKNRKSSILHLCGKFHCEESLGTVYQLLRMNPKLDVLVIVALSIDEWEKLDEASKMKLADVIITTPAKEKDSN